MCLLSKPGHLPHAGLAWADRELTADSVDHERVQLLLAVLALAGEVGHGLHLAVKQVVQQRERHLLRRAAVGADVQHVAGGDGAAHAHLSVGVVTQPRASGVVLYTGGGEQGEREREI